MRKLLLLVIFLCGFASLHADTIDYYHVYFRGKKVAEFHEGQSVSLIVQSDSIGPKDSLNVKVFRDTPCVNCHNSYTMLIFGARGPVMVDTTQHTQSFAIPLMPLLNEKKKSGQNDFHGYYTEFFEGSSKSRVVTFEVRLE